MTSAPPIVQLLADGKFHSGTALGAILGVSRGAVWKQVRQLQALGLEVQAVRGRGYRLTRSLDLLDAEAIYAQLPDAARARLQRLDVVFDLDSTNRYVRAAGPVPGHACLAERQTEGRGRRGRSWVSPLGANIYFSIAWRFSVSTGALGGLSLAAGVAAARALARLGADGVGLKWPNDLWWGHCKLGGVLLELSGEAAGPCDVVVGVGINVAMPAAAGALVDQPWTDLQSILNRRPERNRLASLLLEEVLFALADFEQRGLAPFLDDWRRLDIAAGRQVRLQLPRDQVMGTALGVDETGALLVRSGGTTTRYAAGEISVRLPT